MEASDFREGLTSCEQSKVENYEDLLRSNTLDGFL